VSVNGIATVLFVIVVILAVILGVIIFLKDSTD
jgi:hypothetical protein